MSDNEDPWPVEPSPAVADALADLRLPADQFSKIVALTVAIAQDPWRTVPIPDGGGIIEYAINEVDHRVILTRFYPSDRTTGKVCEPWTCSMTAIVSSSATSRPAHAGVQIADESR